LIFVGVLNGDGGDGARFSAEARLAEAIAVGVRTALVSEPKTIVVVLGEEGMFQAAGLGAALGAYAFDKYLTEPPQRPGSIKVVASGGVTAAAKKSFQLGLRQADGVCLARDLINEPPNVLTPKEFSLRAREVAKKNKLTCKILDHAGIKKAGMHLHDAVGKGSENSPYFIHLCYKPARSQGKLCFVGKGLTFDSGGLCIKPGPSMPEMKTDMSGGAAVLGLMEAVAAFAPNVEVHGIIGAAENMPDAAAYRPSDVLPSLSGKGVEIINTDAEGRLVLADALTYATRLKPDLIVDAATLTGATLVSLGAPCSAYFTNNEGIAAAMGECSAAAGESFWRMPLLEELRLQLKSTVTDLKHTGDRWGGAITAALFLREFTEGLPWMHCDIPGAVFRDRPSGMHPLGGTGHAVLTFLQLVLRHEKEPMVKKASSSSSREAVRKTRASKK
jgi:leucyl aminopeptidase